MFLEIVIAVTFGVVVLSGGRHGGGFWYMVILFLFQLNLLE